MKKIFKIITLFFLVCIFQFTYAAQPKNWTFLIYLNGDNNLDSYGVSNLQDMEKVGSNDQINIVVQWASLSQGKAVRMLIQKSTDPDNVTSPVIEDLGMVDMGDYHNLEDFIQWGVQNFPAQHYFVDVWNHGSGWHLTKKKFGLQRNIILGDISYDETTGHSISTEHLGEVMRFAAKIIGHKVDIYASDACLMAMAEVANEMSDAVTIYAGSQETEPADGWAYADLLSQWQATPNATPEQVAKILVDTYVKSYQGGSNGRAEVTYSAFDMGQLSNLNQTIKKLSEDIRALNTTDRAKVTSVIRSVQTFRFSDYGDLIDFTKKLSAEKINNLNPQHINDVKIAATHFVIANEVTKRYKNATGLSIWLPKNTDAYESNSERYMGLKFHAETQWGGALAALFQNA